MGSERRNYEAGLYSFSTHEHVVFYRSTDEELVVRRILHKRRLPESFDFE
jgi:plasmid stabilization system protein ParE